MCFGRKIPLIWLMTFSVLVTAAESIASFFTWAIFLQIFGNEEFLVSDQSPELPYVLDGQAEHHVHHHDREDDDERDKDELVEKAKTRQVLRIWAAINA